MSLRSILEMFKSPGDTKTVFSNIYHKNYWQGSESRSGKGSDAVQTRVLCRELSALLSKLNVQSILDVPCGDFNWMREVVGNNNLDYTGGDIVDQLVDEDNKLYGSPSIRFEKIDVIKDSLPKADLLICRDCLVHLSNKEVLLALANIRAGNFKYVALTSFLSRKSNPDIRTGKWRPLNMHLAPFNLPQPVAVIDEKCTEAGGRFSDKTLSVWRSSDFLNLNF